MSFMDVLKAKPIIIEKSMPIVKEDYTSRPLYRKLESRLEEISGLSAPVPTIMQAVDEAIKDSQQSDVELSAEEEKQMKVKIKSLKEELKLVDKTSKKAYQNRIENLEKIISRLEELKETHDEIMERLEPLKKEYKELEGGMGEEAQTRAKELNEKIRPLEKEINEIKSNMRFAFTGTFSYRPVLPEEKTEGKMADKVSKKPRNERQRDGDAEYDITFSTGIANYKKRVEEYNKLEPIVTSKKDKAITKDKIKQQIDSLERQVKTGKKDRPLLITSKGGIGRQENVNAVLVNAIRQLNMSEYADEIVDKLSPKIRQRVKRQERELNNQEEALMQLIDELNAEEISSSTETRLQVNNMLNNRFLYNMTLNVSGERDNIHPDVVNALREPDVFEDVVRKMKEIKPSLKRVKSKDVRTVMQSLRTAKTDVSQIARQVLSRQYPDNIEYKDLLALNSESDLSKLLDKLGMLVASWDALSDRFFLDAEDVDEQYWSDEKIVAEIKESWETLLEDAPEIAGLSEEEMQSKYNEHLKKGYSRLVKQMEKLYKSIIMYYDASMTLLDAFISAKGFRYQLPATSDWSGILTLGAGEKRDTDLALETIRKNLMETKKDVDGQRTIMKGFIPNIDDYIQSLEEDNVDSTLLDEYERASKEAQRERVRQAKEEDDKKIRRDKDNPYSRRATTETMREASKPFLEQPKRKKEEEE